jgi:hypothetical protein
MDNDVYIGELISGVGSGYPMFLSIYNNTTKIDDKLIHLKLSNGSNLNSDYIGLNKIQTKELISILTNILNERL